MKLNKASITILFDRDRGLEIQLHDSDASITFAEVRLTAEQVVSAFARMSHTPCEIEVTGLDIIGKRHESAKHVFEIPDNWTPRSHIEELQKLAQETTPEGWVSDGRFSSQDSFFTEGDKHFARVIIRRWV